MIIASPLGTQWPIWFRPGLSALSKIVPDCLFGRHPITANLLAGQKSVADEQPDVTR
jgi:hypothetical protein